MIVNTIPTIRSSKGQFIKGVKYQLGIKASKKTREKQRLAKLKNPTRYWLGKERTDLPASVRVRKDGYRYIAYSLIEKPYRIYLKRWGFRPVPEHHYVWVQHNKREVPPKFHIHHINEIKTDNRIENLLLMTASEHSRHWHSKRNLHLL